MENKIRLSDVIKYLLVGGLFISMLVICYLVLFATDKSNTELHELFSNFVELPSFVITVLIIAPSYFVGLFIHAFNELLISLSKRNFKKLEKKQQIFTTSSNPKEKYPYITIEIFFRKTFYYILNLFYKCTIEDVSISMKRDIKNKSKYISDVPVWISLSKEPHKTLKILSEKISEKDADVKGEYLYLNEFILGVRLSIYIISLIMIWGGIENGFTTKLWLELLFTVAIFIILFSMFAKVFARKYIRYIDSCIKANNISTEEVLMQEGGLACAYILIRSTTHIKHEYFDKMFNSVLNQNYPNIKIILLEDISKKCNTTTTTETLSEYLKEQQQRCDIPEIIYCKSEVNGAAGASIEIRNKFVEVANKCDIAILLDDDDELASNTAVYDIMSKMIITDADICLVGFKETNQLGLSLISNKKHYDSLLHEISQYDKAIEFDDINYLCRAASMAWTKCLKQPIVEKYCEIIKDQEEKRKVKELKPFNQLLAYEDFTDYMIFLFDKIKITAITDTIYSYKKHDLSITSINNLTTESFKEQRIGFLHYLINCVYTPKSGVNFTENHKNSLTEFLKYKTFVITEILDKEFKVEDQDTMLKLSQKIDYSITNFWEDYKDTATILSEQNETISKILTINDIEELRNFYLNIEKRHNCS